MNQAVRSKISPSLIGLRKCGPAIDAGMLGSIAVDMERLPTASTRKLLKFAKCHIDGTCVNVAATVSDSDGNVKESRATQIPLSLPLGSPELPLMTGSETDDSPIR